MASHKLVAVVVRAEGLSAASGTVVFVGLRFNGDTQYTTRKTHTVSPSWKECFSFDVSDPERLDDLSLDANVYSIDERSSRSRKVNLGKVRLQGTRFVPLDEAASEAYTLKKRRKLSWGGKGKLVLKVSLENVNRSSDSTTGDAAADDSTVNNVRAQVLTDGQNNELRRLAQVSRRPDFAVSSISPSLGAGQMVDGRLSPVGHRDPVPANDLVEVMWYIFVSVVKGRNLPAMSSQGSLDPYVEVEFGSYKVETENRTGDQNPEWGVVFAFSDEHIQSSKVQVILKSRDEVRPDVLGKLSIDLRDIPMHQPPESALTAQWYKLMNERMETTDGELMLSIWKGTQADEAFRDAWHSDSATHVHPSPITSELRSTVYSAPVMWHVRLDIIRGVVPASAGNTRLSTLRVKSQIGRQIHRTRPADIINRSWSDEQTFFFMVAEPFEDDLILSIESFQVNEDISFVVPLASIQKQTDGREINTQCIEFQKLDGSNGNKTVAKVDIRLCLEGRYWVPVDSICYSGDLRSTLDQHSSSKKIGLVELGIIRAEALAPMRTIGGRGTYCVIKYGRKWVRTRTIKDSQSPRFNEQYSWDVYDPCTVVTIGIFDNGHIIEGSSTDVPSSKHTMIGKVRIRLSTLMRGRLYALSYPLTVVSPVGVRRMGELHVTIRFSYKTFPSMCRAYLRPLLPALHYTIPIDAMTTGLLHTEAIYTVATCLTRQEPPLRKEVVQSICEGDCDIFRMQKTKTDSTLSRFVAFCRDIAMWKDTATTVLCHAIFLMALSNLEFLIATVAVSLFMPMSSNIGLRHTLPEHLDPSISGVGDAHLGDLDEEFDQFPGIKTQETVTMWYEYERLRTLTERLRKDARSIMVHLERVEALFSWRDPTATSIFFFFCMAMSAALVISPTAVMCMGGLYVMRHPRFRGDTPSALLNLYSRLPCKHKCMM
ncbi:FT-interacting protein 1 [Brachypodium distachyon]|uniref:C2 domain-containing protein n=2 Tax=Brachypodium distachyon TaxID=15368 RepID=I1HGG7_BRADI|nr:FT-interacting protein 1 [Brachypodium distachyon]PNT70717.1 hypothetical protein BRADI_2g16690v3 [Brachypodium distachyon]PNT70718.1 hypothetical protein BRADI_2g16690v3 [Brachypodium distachyon]|eukprot:XP_003565921.1 FT-interacting protein 1 [Brachypodium distachyon]